MAPNHFRVRVEGTVFVVEVWGPLDEAAAEDLLEFAAAAGPRHTVKLDIDAVESMTPEAAALLRSPRSRWRSFVRWLSFRHAP